MIIDLNVYRRSILPQVKLWCDAKEGNPKDHIADISLATSCPIVAVAYYVSELYGTTPELEEYIKKLVDFYHIDDIVGIEALDNTKLDKE